MGLQARRSAKNRNALRVSAHFFVPKIWTSMPRKMRAAPVERVALAVPTRRPPIDYPRVAARKTILISRDSRSRLRSPAPGMVPALAPRPPLAAHPGPVPGPSSLCSELMLQQTQVALAVEPIRRLPRRGSRPSNRSQPPDDDRSRRHGTDSATMPARVTSTSSPAWSFATSRARHPDPAPPSPSLLTRTPWPSSPESAPTPRGPWRASPTRSPRRSSTPTWPVC